MKFFKASVVGVLSVSFLAITATSPASAMGPSRPKSLEGVYELREPCTGYPEITICCGPGDIWTDLPLPTAGHVYDRKKDGRYGGYRPFEVGTQLRIEAGKEQLSMTPITAQGEAQATVLASKSSRSRRVRYTKNGFRVRDRFSVPATGMSFRFDIFRYFDFRKLQDGSLEVQYHTNYFTRAEPTVCRLDKISN